VARARARGATSLPPSCVSAVTPVWLVQLLRPVAACHGLLCLVRAACAMQVRRGAATMQTFRAFRKLRGYKVQERRPGDEAASGAGAGNGGEPGSGGPGDRSGQPPEVRAETRGRVLGSPALESHLQRRLRPPLPRPPPGILRPCAAVALYDRPTRCAEPSQCTVRCCAYRLMCLWLSTHSEQAMDIEQTTGAGGRWSPALASSFIPVSAPSMHAQLELHTRARPLPEHPHTENLSATGLANTQ
jgi:hypothetical protein